MFSKRISSTFMHKTLFFVIKVGQKRLPRLGLNVLLILNFLNFANLFATSLKLWTTRLRVSNLLLSVAIRTQLLALSRFITVLLNVNSLTQLCRKILISRHFLASTVNSLTSWRIVSLHDALSRVSLTLTYGSSSLLSILAVVFWMFAAWPLKPWLP